MPRRKRFSSNLRAYWGEIIELAFRKSMSKVDYLLSSSRYRAFKISVFLAQKNKNYKIGEAKIKPNKII